MVVHETRGKKLQHFYQLVLNMVWDFWKSYARTFRCLALLRWERTRDKGAMRTILGSNFILCWTLNLHWYVFLGSCDHWIIAFSQINGCYSSRMPFLPYKGFALTLGHLKTVKCEWLLEQRALASANVCEAGLIADCECFWSNWIKQKLSNLYMICSNSVKKFLSNFLCTLHWHAFTNALH